MSDLVTTEEPCEGVILNDTVAVSFFDDSTIDDVEAYEKVVKDNAMSDVDGFNEQNMVDKLCNGMYARVLKIPKGSFLTGALHKNPYIDIFVYGDVTVKSFYANGDIEAVERVNSFRFFDGKPGRKRVLVAHEDTLWITVDPTECEVIEDARGDIAHMSYKEFKGEIE